MSRAGTYVGMHGDKRVRVRIVRRYPHVTKIRVYRNGELGPVEDAHPESVVDGWNDNGGIQR